MSASRSLPAPPAADAEQSARADLEALVACGLSVEQVHRESTERWGIEVFEGCRHLASGGLSKGKKAATLLGADVPTLLRDAAGLFQREGGWAGFVRAIKSASVSRVAEARA